MEEKRRLHFTSPGFRSQEIVIAPALDDSKSKRRPLIEGEDKILDVQIVELDEGTKARNRAFQKRLDEIWASTSGWEAKLRTEAKEAVETIMNMKDDYQKHINKFNQSLQDEINSIFDKVDAELIPAELARIDTIEKDADFFVRDTVPAAIERQSGEVSRQLRRAYETFEIEKKKECKRELKLADKASHHMQNTAQRFDDENALMSSCFFNLEDDIMEYERNAARMHLLRNATSIDAIELLNSVAETERTLRTSEDVEVLDTVIETQGLLQQTVLMHFGTQSENAELFAESPRDFPVMDKLNQRMEKINDKKSVQK